MLHGIDLSRWQAGLKVADLPASISFVNVNLSRGVTVPPNLAQHRPTWVVDARKTGRHLLAYHWLDATAPGAEQWAFAKTQALAVFGSLAGWGLQLDCESDATYDHVLGFVRAARADLGRPVAFYSGDWWLASRSWPRLDVDFPYLWAAANDGWLPSAPAETSRHWIWTGKGGWPHLSMLQWSDKIKHQGIAVSSTVADPRALCALTGRHIEV
jgi:hypothetical protein